MVEKESGNFQAYQGALTLVMTGLIHSSIILWVLQFKNNDWWMIYRCHIHLYRRTSPLIWDTSIQETPQSRGHKIWSAKNVHTIFVFVMSIEGTLPLFRGKGHFFWVLIPGFNFHSGETLAIKLWLTIKVVDKFKCSLLQKWQLSKRELTWLKSMYCTCGKSTHDIEEIS